MSPITPRRQQQGEHLAQVQALLQAVSSAISAIEKNDLPEFEKRLAAQETICHRLSASMPALLFSAVDGAEDSAEAQLLQEVRKAHADLAHLNRVYAALLKRARRSVTLMAAFYRNHAPVPQYHTWSCDI